MQNKPFDVITVNETRLGDSVPNGEVEIPGFDTVLFGVIEIETEQGLQFV